MTPLEQAVLEKLLSGESERYQILRKQYDALRVSERKMTGVGFFTRFSIPDEVPKLPDEASLHISDVAADLTDLEHGAGFVLFIKKGGINMLEGFTYGEPWPRIVRSFHLYYDGTSKRR
ncbi:MAG: hypothetical protein WBF22_16515 [Methylocella sp.]